MYGPTPITEDNNNITIPNQFEEHERRQRSIRILMMILMFLILLDGEEPPRRKNLRNRKSKPFPKLEKSIWNQRRHLDTIIGKYRSEQREKIIKLNGGVDEEANVQKFTLDHLLEDDSVAVSSSKEDNKKTKTHIRSMEDAKHLLDQVEEEDRLVYHYPTNSSGFYRGTWKRGSFTNAKQVLTKGTSSSSPMNPPEGHEEAHLMTREQVLNLFPDPFIGLQFLPQGFSLEGNVTTHFNRSLDHNATQETQTNLITTGPPIDSLEVTNDSGTMYMQLYSRPIPGMTEISLIDGIVRLVDITDGSIFSLQKDLLMRVRGVIFHSMGKLSLVGNDDQGIRRNVLVVKQDDEVSASKRKLYDVTNEIVDSYEELYDKEIIGGPMWEKYMQSSEDSNALQELSQRRLMMNEDANSVILQNYIDSLSVVETYPFVAESSQTRHSLSKPPAVVIRSTPEILMKNGRSCEFVLDFNITERQWPISEWRSMMKRIMINLRKSDPTYDQNEETDNTKKVKRGSSNTYNRENSNILYTDHTNEYNDDSMVTHMSGTIYSEQCNFFSNLNVTAHRTDMEQVTAKAINYCFFMFIACLAQAVFLLRQMIYSQPQSSAIRVSIICIGWQTVLDALLSLEHLWLCFYILPVATAFAMVAFLKAMIFMAIEMKYCVMIMKARMEANRINVTQDEIRQKTARFYFKFYTVLVSVTFLLYYVGVHHLTGSILLIYSFWVPQIILNIVTEARKPLHENYTQGMSVTRLLAPLYTFGMPHNFFKELEPEFQTDFLTCQLLIIWLGIQAAILWGQSKYGARFMIPSRFLPPKFDYHRPIPSSLLPKPLDRLKSSEEEPESTLLLENNTVISGHTGGGPRNRKVKSDIGKTTIHTVHNSTCDRPSLDCVICYNDIDVGDREKYMLAPCDHIFHKECLTQWMEVKMECPVCRTDLPAL